MTDFDRARDGVITAAGRLFAEKGFAGTQMAEVARAAGMGVGTLYKHVPSKEALFGAMLERFFGGLLARAQGALAAPAADLPAALAAYAEAALGAVAADPEASLAVARETRGSRLAFRAAAASDLWTRVEAHRAEVGELFVRRAGELAPGLAPRDAAVFFLGALWTFAEHDLNRGAPEALPGRAPLVVALVLGGVGGAR